MDTTDYIAPLMTFSSQVLHTYSSTIRDCIFLLLMQLHLDTSARVQWELQYSQNKLLTYCDMMPKVSAISKLSRTSTVKQQIVKISNITQS
jgi:hypothetical protein